MIISGIITKLKSEVNCVFFLSSLSLSVLLLWLYKVASSKVVIHLPLANEDFPEIANGHVINKVVTIPS